MKRELKLRWQWKLILLMISFIFIFYLGIKVNNYINNKAKACDLNKGYSCTYYEIERYIRYEK